MSLSELRKKISMSQQELEMTQKDRIKAATDLLEGLKRKNSLSSSGLESKPDSLPNSPVKKPVLARKASADATKSANKISEERDSESSLSPPPKSKLKALLSGLRQNSLRRDSFDSREAQRSNSSELLKKGQAAQGFFSVLSKKLVAPDDVLKFYGFSHLKKPAVLKNSASLFASLDRILRKFLKIWFTKFSRNLRISSFHYFLTPKLVLSPDAAATDDPSSSFLPPSIPTPAITNHPTSSTQTASLSPARPKKSTPIKSSLEILGNFFRILEKTTHQKLNYFFMQMKSQKKRQLEIAFLKAVISELKVLELK
jgi:hypothetical protein